MADNIQEIDINRILKHLVGRQTDNLDDQRDSFSQMESEVDNFYIIFQWSCIVFTIWGLAQQLAQLSMHSGAIASLF